MEQGKPICPIIQPNHFGIEAIFKYNYARSKFNTDTGGVTTSTTTKTNQFSLSMGLQYYFGGLRRVRN